MPGVTHPSAAGWLQDPPVLGDSQEQGAVLHGDAPLSRRWEGQHCHSSLEIEGQDLTGELAAKGGKEMRQVAVEGGKMMGQNPCEGERGPCTAPALGLCRMHSVQFFRQVNHFL